MTEVQKIVTEINRTGNQQGRIYDGPLGCVYQRADLRGQIVWQIWPRGSGPLAGALVLARKDNRTRQWLAQATDEEAQAWLDEARRQLNPDATARVFPVLWSVESAAGFTTQVDRDGQVSYE